MQGPGEAGQSAERQEGWERKGLQGAARRLQAGRLERSQRLGVLGWAVAATLQSGHSLSLVCRRRLAVVDVPVWQGVGHRGALRGPGGKVLQQISKAKRRGGEHHHPYPSLSITSQQVAADKGTGLPPGLLWGPGWGPGQTSGCPWFPPASAAWCQGTPLPLPPTPPPIQASLKAVGGVVAPGQRLWRQNSSSGPGPACCLLSQPRRVRSLSLLLHTRGISGVSSRFLVGSGHQPL